MSSVARLLIVTGICGVVAVYMMLHTDLLTHLTPFLSH